MKKKKYVAPEVSVIEMEPLQIMAGSVSDRGWTPDGDKKNGFDIVEEEENGDYEF
ncbi:hypothetical protein [Prevotella sp.]|uniref:hypothetical protein n=1 Tax=Prevotella sp. TaxID=59823 RepID=UPI00307BE367